MAQLVTVHSLLSAFMDSRPDSLWCAQETFSGSCPPTDKLNPRPRVAFTELVFLTLTEVFLTLTEVFLTLTEGFLTLTEVFLTLTEVFLTLTEVFLTLTEVFLTLTEVFLNLTEVFLTLTEVFLCFFLSCKANARIKLAKTGHGPHSSTLVVICVVLCIVCV